MCSIYWFQRLSLIFYTTIQCNIISKISFFVEGNNDNTNTNNITKSYDDEILHHLELFHYSEELHVLGPTRFPKPTEIFQTISSYEDISNIQDIVPYIRPVHGKHRPYKDALVAFAAEYPISNYLSFIESLRITGFKGDIILSISVLDMQKEDVWTYLTNADDDDEEDGLRVILYAPKLTCYNAENEEVDSFKGGARGTLCILILYCMEYFILV